MENNGAHINKKIPSSSPVPVVGSLPKLFKDAYSFLIRAPRDYGDVYQLNLGFKKFIAFNHPNHVERIMKSQIKKYAKLTNVLKKLVGSGILASEGETWLRQRRMIQPFFLPQNQESLLPGITEVVDQVMDQWEVYAEKKIPLNVSHATTELSAKILVRTMFGSGIKAEEAIEIDQNMKIILDHILLAVLTESFPNWIPVPGRKKYTAAMNRVNQILYGIIQKTRRGQLGEGGLLEKLIHVRDEETGKAMDDLELRDQVFTIYTGGYDTTATTLAWTIYLLTQSPGALEKMNQEVYTILGNRQVQFQDLKKLEYTLGTSYEALRLYSIAYAFPRKVVEEDIVDGFLIPKGSTALVVTCAVHHHPDFWEEPFQFRPERFAPDSVAKRHRFAWFPFGAGPRVCIAQDFANTEMRIILSRMVQRFRIKGIEGQAIKPHMGFLLRPNHDVMVHLEKK